MQIEHMLYGKYMDFEYDLKEKLIYKIKTMWYAFWNIWIDVIV